MLSLLDPAQYACLYNRKTSGLGVRLSGLGTRPKAFLRLVDMIKLSREKTYGEYQSTNDVIADAEDDITWYKKDEIRYDRIAQQQK